MPQREVCAMTRTKRAVMRKEKQSIYSELGSAAGALTAILSEIMQRIEALERAYARVKRGGK